MKPSEYLLRAILESPADDLARLAYADALEEEGDTTGQAELIRAGDDPAAICKALRDTRYADIIAEAFEGKPVAGNGQPWLQLFYGKDDKKLCATLFLSCGFVRRVDTDLRWWQKHGKTLCEMHPVREAYGFAIGWGWDGCQPRMRSHDAWEWPVDTIRRCNKLEESLREFLCIRLTQRFCSTADEARADFNAACLEWAKPEWLRPKRSSNTATANYASTFSALNLFRSRADHMPVLLDPRRIIRGTT